jgi:protein-disulfide isomerase
LLQKEREVAEAFEAYGTPGAVIVRPDGTIGSSLAMGPDAIRDLVAQTLRIEPKDMLAALPTVPQNGQNGSKGTAIPQVSPPKIGQSAPQLKFRDLKGETVTLTSFGGSKTLVIFWNPGCGFCQQMLDDLKKLDADPLPGGPKLLVISTGAIEDNLAMNLSSPVVVDPDFQSGPAFGANGTPMAVLLDDEGKVASEIAAGADAVLALAGAKRNEPTAAAASDFH